MNVGGSKLPFSSFLLPVRSYVYVYSSSSRADDEILLRVRGSERQFVDQKNLMHSIVYNIIVGKL